MSLYNLCRANTIIEIQYHLYTLQLAQNVLVMFGESVDDLQDNLEQIGAGLLGQKGDKKVVGVITPPATTWPQKTPTYVHTQQFSHNPDKTIEDSKDQELIDQLNVALEVMAAGQIFIIAISQFLVRTYFKCQFAQGPILTNKSDKHKF